MPQTKVRSSSPRVHAQRSGKSWAPKAVVLTVAHTPGSHVTHLLELGQHWDGEHNWQKWLCNRLTGNILCGAGEETDAFPLISVLIEGPSWSREQRTCTHVSTPEDPPCTILGNPQNPTFLKFASVRNTGCGDKLGCEFLLDAH